MAIKIKKIKNKYNPKKDIITRLCGVGKLVLL